MSKNQIATTVFDYSGIDDETAAKLRYYAESGRALVRKSMIRFIAEFGEALSNARKLLSHHGDGTFCKWAESEFDLSRKTVYNYVNAWERCLCNGFTMYDNVTPTALYLLSHDGTPKSIRDKVLKLAGKQTTVSKADVDALLHSGALTQGVESPEPDPQIANSPPHKEEDTAPAEEAETEAPKPQAKKKLKDVLGVDYYGRCPNCLGTKWDEDDEGVSCARCHHPHGESTGGPDEDRIQTQRQKSRKTAEALMRAFDDLQTLKARPEHEEAIRLCKVLVAMAQNWK